MVMFESQNDKETRLFHTDKACLKDIHRASCSPLPDRFLATWPFTKNKRAMVSNQFHGLHALPKRKENEEVKKKEERGKKEETAV